MNRLLSVIRRLKSKHIDKNHSATKKNTMANNSVIPSVQISEQPPSQQQEEIGFDPEAVAAKYAAEREKRLRQDASAQYIAVEGIFEHYKEDPYVSGPSTREPLSEDVGTLVIGAGYGGLCTVVRQLERGVTDIRVVEKAGSWGGTWYWESISWCSL